VANPTAEQLRNIKKQGHAMAPAPGAGAGARPRYYIRNAADLDNAIRAVGRGAGDHNAIRKFIMTQARRLNLSSRIPSNWNSDGSMGGSSSGSSGSPGASGSK
jgi:hypothetical protein